LYSKYGTGSTLIKNGQFVIMTEYRMSFVTFDFIYPHTTIGQALGQVNAAVNLNTAAVDIDVIAS